MVDYIVAKGESQKIEIHEARVSKTADKSVDIYPFKIMVPHLFGGPKDSINGLLSIVKLSLEKQSDKMQGGISIYSEG